MFWSAETDYEFGPFRIDCTDRQLFRAGSVVPLTPRVFDLLLALVQHRGRVLTKEEVLQLVWPDAAVEEGNVTRNISTLRGALGEGGVERQYIETIPWRGYRFIARVKQVHHRDWSRIDSIAVLPFLNVNADEGLEYLADGITETLTTKLAQLPNLRVTSRNSSFRYKGQKFDAKKIGSELKVQAVLIGRLVESDKLLSISVELVETRTDRHLWGAQYIRDPSQLLEVQGTIANEIASKLSAELSTGQTQQLAKRHTEVREAHLCFLQGRFYFNKLTFEGVQKGLDYFQQAIQLDQDFALAYAGLADCHNYLAKPDEARKAITKALELDSDLGEAHATLGFFYFLYEWDFKGAEAEFSRALALNSNYAEAHHWFAIYLANIGRHDEAFTEAELAVERDPLSLLMNMTAALNFYTGRKYDRARTQLQKVIDMDAHFPAAHSVLGCVYSQMEMYESAFDEFEKLLSLCKGAELVENSVKLLMAQTYARWGKKRKALQLLSDIGDGPASLYSRAGVFAALGETDRAFEFLNKAFDEHDLQLVSTKVDPSLDRIRNDPRFSKLIRRIGLPN